MRSLSIFWRLIFKGPKSSPLKKVFTICLQSLSIFNKLRFLMSSLFEKTKHSFWTVYSNSHQAVLAKTTSHNLFQIWTPSLFMGSILEKNEKFFNLLETFFQRPKELSSKKSLYNLFTIFIKFLQTQFFDDFSFREIQTQFLNCLFKLTSSCPSKNYFPQSFPDLNSISFHGLNSGEKWEVCQSFGDLFSRAQRALL